MDFFVPSPPSLFLDFLFDDTPMYESLRFSGSRRSVVIDVLSTFAGQIVKSVAWAGDRDKDAIGATCSTAFGFGPTILLMDER